MDAQIGQFLTAATFAAIGFMVAGPAGAMYGWAIGSMVGSLLFPPDKPTMQGPQLSDLKAQKSEYGAAIPRCYGAVRLAGNVIWSSDLIERRVKEKIGDSKVYNYYYSTKCAVMLCHGQIDAVRKIWANGKVIYDASTGERAAGLSFRIYTGTETQTADPTIAADVGVENCPGYRGVAYVVFQNLELQDFGNTLPRLEFLVYKGFALAYPASVDISTSDLTYNGSIIDPQTGYLWDITDADTIKVTDPAAGAVVAVIDVANYAGVVTAGKTDWALWGLAYDTNAGTITAVSYPGYNSAGGTVTVTIDPSDYSLVDTKVLITHPGTNAYEHGGIYDLVVKKAYYYGGTTTLGYLRDITAGVHNTLISINQDINDVLVCARWIDDAGLFHKEQVWTTTQRTLEESGILLPNGPVFYDDHAWLAVCSEAGIYMARYRKVFGTILIPTYFAEQDDFVNIKLCLDDTTAGWGNGTGFCYPRLAYDYTRHVLYATEGAYAHDFLWYADLKNLGEDNYPVFQKLEGFAHNCTTIGYDGQTDRLYIATGDDYYAYSGDPDNLAPVWSRENTGANNGNAFVFSPMNSGWFLTGTGARIYYEPTASGDGPSLASVVQDLVVTSGLTVSDMDVTGLSGNVRGYGIARDATARSAIEPLRKAFLFDGTESDWILRFGHRGSTAVATIADIELGTEKDEKIVVSRKQEVDLPLEVAVNYMDAARDHQTATQRSRKTTSKSDLTNLVTIDLPITMTPNEAVRMADVLLHQDWVSREAYSITTTRKHVGIDPGDVITVEPDGSSYTMLVTAMTLQPDGKVEIEGVRDLSSAYVSTSVASSGEFTVPTVSTPYPTAFQMTDLPWWGPSPVGPQVFCCGAVGASWRGANVLSSADGDDYLIAGEQTVPAVLGVAGAALGNWAGWYDTLDDTNTVTVTIINPGSASLSSMAGSQIVPDVENLCRIGSEILQFETATQNIDGTWTLSDLWRGRRGTEWAIATHAASEPFALLESSAVFDLVAIADSNFSTTVYAKAVTKGLESESSPAKSIDFTWQYLMPYAPVELEVEVELDGDHVLTWVRRDRKDGTIPDSNTGLSESAEEYELDIYNSGDDTIIRALTGLSSETHTYTAAQQEDDGIASYYFKVYQISADVGRGYAGISAEQASIGGNDFSGDANLAALYNFEPSALTTDSSGNGNTLTDNNTVTVDTVDFRRGLASADFEYANSESLSIADAGLHATFPFKNGTTNKTISVCFWIKVESVQAGDNYILAKYAAASGGRSFAIHIDGSLKISLVIGYNSGNSRDFLTHATGLTAGKWYHVGATYQDSDKSYRIRIWDYEAHAILGTDKTGTAPNNIYLNAQPLYIAASSVPGNYYDGRLDELVITNDVLSSSEIDQIRANVYRP